MESLIRWKRGDYIRLSKAVSRFNNVINTANELDMDNLPDIQTYSELKSSITTRKELNRVINSLNRANTENLSETIKFDSGETLTKYEYDELKKQRTSALRSLTLEKNKILKERPSIGMGDERISEIEAIQDSLLNLEEKTGRNFEKTIERIQRLGVSDRKMKKALIFRENMYTALEGISNFENYELLKKELDKIKNPHKFFDYVQQSPILMDVFLWYKNPEVLHYGSFSSNQEAFNSSLLFHLGIEDIEE